MIVELLIGVVVSQVQGYKNNIKRRNTMKKLVGLMVIILLFACPVAFGAAAAVSASAGTQGLGMQTYTTINGAGPGTVTNVSTSTITAGKHAILGYKVTVTGTNCEGFGTLVDAISTTLNQDLFVIDESEAVAAYGSISVIFPKPVMLSKGLTIRQGALTCVTVYYSKVR